MKTAIFQALIDEIDSTSVADEATKKAFKNLVRRLAKQHGFTVLERGERVEFARDMLAKNVHRVVIRDRLSARFEVSKTQAYRDIEDALQLSQKVAFFGNFSESNSDKSNAYRGDHG